MAARIEHRADSRERRADLRVVGDINHVAPKRETKPEAQAGAMHGGERRSGKMREPLDEWIGDAFENRLARLRCPDRPPRDRAQRRIPRPRREIAAHALCARSARSKTSLSSATIALLNAFILSGRLRTISASAPVICRSTAIDATSCDRKIPGDQKTGMMSAAVMSPTSTPSISSSGIAGNCDAPSLDQLAHPRDREPPVVGLLLVRSGCRGRPRARCAAGSDGCAGSSRANPRTDSAAPTAPSRGTRTRRAAAW